MKSRHGVCLLIGRIEATSLLLGCGSSRSSAAGGLSSPVNIVSICVMKFAGIHCDTYMMLRLTKETPIMKAQLGILEKPQMA